MLKSKAYNKFNATNLDIISIYINTLIIKQLITIWHFSTI